jgi:polyhydroxybutyrate depolymerase
MFINRFVLLNYTGLLKRFRLFALLFFLFVAGFFRSQTFATFTHDGVIRTYHYYVPSYWNSGESMPLLMVLHGLTQSGQGIMNITNFNSLAESEGFIAVYPDGLENAWNADMNVTVSGADDIGFLERLVLHFETNFGVNSSRIYFTGFSNGGFMSNKLACESSLCIAAIASVSGNMSSTVYENCNPKQPTSVLHIHGTADAVVSYFGSPTTGVSVGQSMDKWRDFLGCSESPVVEEMPNVNLLDLSNAEWHRYLNCTQGVSLELIKVNGGGHQWPGINTLLGGVGTINMDFYSPEVIWNFLKGKSCASQDILDNELETTTIYPNPASDIVHIHGSSGFQLELFDQLGHDFTMQLVVHNNNTFDCSHLKSGIYWMQLSNESVSIRRKLILTR